MAEAKIYFTTWSMCLGNVFLDTTTLRECMHKSTIHTKIIQMRFFARRKITGMFLLEKTAFGCYIYSGTIKWLLIANNTVSVTHLFGNNSLVSKQEKIYQSLFYINADFRNVQREFWFSCLHMHDNLGDRQCKRSIKIIISRKYYSMIFRLFQNSYRFLKFIFIFKFLE